ncbi:hypothetical protein AA313_de0209527 [Arthrobotrys entomopaga]|nr:hypothetical protein AA313_de0209527 [Arthrobotrys entomopaga]
MQSLGEMSESFSSDDYSIGWICALPLEFAAAIALLDQKHPELPRDESDDNTYQFGRMGHCNVIITALPAGVYGTTSAATVATNLRRSFPHLTACLMVGIGGGAPLLPQNDVRLGDVVVGHPIPGYGGIIQYDFGKTVKKGRFVQTGVLNKPPAVLLQTITKLKSDFLLRGNNNTLNDRISHALETKSIPKEFSRPSPESDRLFEAAYDHHNSDVSCEYCNPIKILERPPRLNEEPVIHYGLIASGNQVMKHGRTRERLSREKNILCFEMEAAGIVDELPTLVIRGICDYCDSHKNKIWQPYAAIAAAAFAKELVLQLPLRDDTAFKRPNRRGAAKDTVRDDMDTSFYESLRSLGATNPQDDRSRIERAKDDLVEESCSWIFSTEEFQTWYSTGAEKPILWITGDPGKGKTMLTMAIIDYLENSSRLKQANATGISYFFCQANDDRQNSAISILKGVIFQILSHAKFRSLRKYLIEEFDTKGSNCFSGPNALYALQRVISSILSDKDSVEIYILIDALDEVVDGLDHLLHFVCNSIPTSRGVKWLLTSRNYPNIEEHLSHSRFQSRIMLENNRAQIVASVDTFIKAKVEILSQRKHYSTELSARVTDILQSKSEGTFLWVHLACKELAKSKRRKALSTLEALPSGLDGFYENMFNKIQTSNLEEDYDICSRVLSSALIANRPLRLLEIWVVAGLPYDMDEHEIEEHVKQCGSFLVIQNKTIFFVHQSSKDFLDGKIGTKLIMPGGLVENHRTIAWRCLMRLSKDLKMDFCDLKEPGFSVSDISEEQTNRLIPLDYACSHWVSHVKAIKLFRHDENLIWGFLKTHLLHWLEVLLLVGASAEITSLLMDLESLVTYRSDLRTLLRDAIRFVRYNSTAISSAPLQIYSSGLIFTPENSLIKKRFSDLIPSWIKFFTRDDEPWTSTIKTFEHKGFIRSIVFSEDSKKMASISPSEVRVWDVTSGLLLFCLNDESADFESIVFSPDNRWLALRWGNGILEVRQAGPSGFDRFAINDHSHPTSNASTLSPEQIITTPWGNGSSLCTLRFSADSQRLVSGSRNGKLEIWDFLRGTQPQSWTLSASTKSGLFGFRFEISRDATKLALLALSVPSGGSGFETTPGDNYIHILDVSSGRILDTLKIPNDINRFEIFLLDFSPDGKVLACGISGELLVWNLEAASLTRMRLAEPLALRDKKLPVSIAGTCSIHFSRDGTQLATAMRLIGERFGSVHLWDVASGARIKTIIINDSKPLSRFSSSLAHFACNHGLDSFLLSDLTAADNLHSFPRYLEYINVISPNGRQILRATVGSPQFQFWDTEVDGSYYERMFSTPPVPRGDIVNAVFSPCGKVLALVRSSETSDHSEIELWNNTTGLLMYLISGGVACFSPVYLESTALLATGSEDGLIQLWDIKMEPADSFENTAKEFNLSWIQLHEKSMMHPGAVQFLSFSGDGKLLASGNSSYRFQSDHLAAMLWEVVTCTKLRALHLPQEIFENPSVGWTRIRCLALSPDGSRMAAVSFRDVILWDTHSGDAILAIPDATWLSWCATSVSFIKNSSLIQTNRGIIDLRNRSNISALAENPFAPRSLEYLLKIAPVLEHNGKKVLWFPPELEPKICLIRENRIFLEDEYGLFMVIELPDLDPGDA